MRGRKPVILFLIFILLVLLYSCSAGAKATAYETVVSGGYTGTQEEFLAALVGENGDASGAGEIGGTAYELAVKKGYTGSEAEWFSDILGKETPENTEGKTVYEAAVENGFNGTLAEWLAALVK